MSFKGKLIILASPSGAGKSTLARHLLHAIPELSFSISATTRAPRPTEEDGREYYFLTVDEFKERIATGDFVEHEEVYPGLFYGTLRSELQRIWSHSQHALFDVDVVGALNIKKQFQEQALTLFVSPPSLDALRFRLSKRGTETEKSLETRIQKAVWEMEFAPRFDHTIINDDLELACTRAERTVRVFLGL